jgi:hypothetical protein
MIHDNDDTRAAFFGPDNAHLMAEMSELLAEITASGELLSTEALADPSQTKTVRPRDGKVMVTDGPLAEAKEHFAGYLVVDCVSLERATEIAVRWPNSRFGAMEVRPILDIGADAEPH